MRRKLACRMTILLSANLSIRRGTMVTNMRSELTPLRICSANRSRRSESICSEVSDILKLASSRKVESRSVKPAKWGAMRGSLFAGNDARSCCSSAMPCARTCQLPTSRSAVISRALTKPNSTCAASSPSAAMPGSLPPGFSYTVRNAGGNARMQEAKSESPISERMRARAWRPD